MAGFRALVSWSWGSVAVAADGVDDLVGGLGPLEGAGGVVPELDPFLEGGSEFFQGAERAAIGAAALDLGEPPLD